MSSSGDDNEKLSFHIDISKQSQYGTSSKSVVKKDSYIKHTVVPGDTLQGLSLKYDVAIEHIKRANNLWTNDSLFVREVLLIPSSNTDDNSEDFSQSCDDCPEYPYLSLFVKGASQSRILNQCQSEEVHLIVDNVGVDAKAADKVDFKDYLSKIDSKIRVAKENVSKFETRFRYPD